MIKVICPNCGQHYEAEDKHAGMSVLCEECGTDMNIPQIQKVQQPVCPVVRVQPPPKQLFSFDIRFPILSIIFVIFGIGMFFFIIKIIDFYSKFYEPTSAVKVTSTVAVMLCAFIGLICFGVAQVIYAICETASNTRELLKIARKE